MIKQFVITSIMTCLLSHFTAAQTNKIKIAKENTEYKNDTCEFKIVIPPSLQDKELIIHSFTISGKHDSTIALTTQHQNFAMSFIEQEIKVTPATIRDMFISQCKINGIRLIKVLLQEHPAKKKEYQNRVEIIMIYE